MSPSMLSGETSFWLTGSVNTETMSAILDGFSRERASATGAEIDLVLDQAGWHTSGHLAVPDGLSLVYLPSHSPELQPSEHLWPLLDEVVANCVPKDLGELEGWVSRRCVALSEDRVRVRCLTLFS